MTLQREEVLVHRGRRYALLVRPLESCADPDVRVNMHLIQMQSTSLARGYQGVWEIRAGRLWLTELHATIREYTSTDDWHHAQRDLRWLFPGADGPVSADWFSGELRAGRGTPERTHLYAQDWPYYRVYRVERGRVLSSALQDNRIALRAGGAVAARLTKYLDNL